MRLPSQCLDAQFQLLYTGKNIEPFKVKGEFLNQKVPYLNLQQPDAVFCELGVFVAFMNRSCQPHLNRHNWTDAHFMSNE